MIINLCMTDLKSYIAQDRDSIRCMLLGITQTFDVMDNLKNVSNKFIKNSCGIKS